MRKPRFATLLAILCLLSIYFTAQAQQVSVNAADYTRNLAPGALASAFGADLADGTAAAQLPLPTELAGARVLVNGRAAKLLYVSPAQINYQIPENTTTGDVEIVVERTNGAKFRENAKINSAGFAAFSFDATGTGSGAILDGRTFTPGPHEIVTKQGEPTILALFGTGLGEARSKDFVSKRVRVFVGGNEAKVHYAGPQNFFTGLDQINFELPANVADHGMLPLMVKIDDQPTNAVTVELKATETASVSFAVEESFTSSSEIAGLKISPFPDIDSLKATVRSVNLVSDKGVEVALLAAPLTVDLLSPEAVAKLVKRLDIKAGTYVALTAEIIEVMASYKGQAVAMKLANKAVKQTLREPIKISKDTTVGVSFAFDLRSSVKKQTDGSYVFDPVLWLRLLGIGTPPTPLQKFEGKIISLDATTKKLQVRKGEGATASTIAVDASKAKILTGEGRPADFSALKTDQKIEVTGQLNGNGVVEALIILIGGTPPPPPRPVIATGTINAINLTNKTFVLNVESLIGVQTLVAVKTLNIKWDDKTKFVDDLRGIITPDKLLVGNRLTANLASFADPALATTVAVFHPHVVGTVADVAGLPNSFVVNLYPDPRVMAPGIRKATVKLTATTKIKTIFGADLKPSDITVGSQIDAVGDMAAGASELTAEYVVVIGMQVRGVTSDVDVAAKTFIVTTENGAKGKVAVNERTAILMGCPTCLPVGFTRPDEFIKLLANKPYIVTVFGVKDASGTMQAFSIGAEEKK